MKNLYFSLLTFLFVVVAHAQIVNIPDPVFKAKLLSANEGNQIASTETPVYNTVNGTWTVSSYNKIDINNDGEIQVSEAQTIKYLDVNTSNILNLEGIQSFPNIIFLGCYQNQLTSLNVQELTNLQCLLCQANQLSSLNVQGLTNLQFLSCRDNDLTSLNIQGLANLQVLRCSSNQLPSLNVQGLTSLERLYCNFNQLPSLNLQGLTNLRELNCALNQLPSLDVQGLSNLQELNCSQNQLPSLNVQGLSNLQELNCSQNQLPSLNVQGLSNLQELNCSQNQLPSLNVQGLTNLLRLDCYTNQLTSLNVQGLTNLSSLNCSNNQLPALNVQGLINLQTLYCDSNQLTSLNVEGLANLQTLACSTNQLPSINVQGLTNLQGLACFDNQLTSLNVQGLTNLLGLGCDGNQLTSLNVQGLENLQQLDCNYNQLASLNLQGLTNLQSLFCFNNNLTSLNVQESANLSVLDCSNNQLSELFIKNLSVNDLGLNFGSNPNLAYICVNEQDLTSVQQLVDNYGYSNCQVNSYCSFTPGGTFYTIQGNNTLDENNNGCDASDSIYPNLKFNITDGTTSGSLISNGLGNYSIPVQEGTHTVTPQFENPSYFTVSPTNAAVSFPTEASPFIQNFCIAPNGIHHDLEVVVIPLDAARPGFDATYKIKYKNKGTLNETATVNFNYNDNILDFVSSSYALTAQSAGLLSWDLGTVAPFQTGEIMVTLNVNSPTETPAVNGGDLLNYSTNIVGLTTDETIDDNTFGLNQTVVNSFDPNDKTCLEGTIINPSNIGKYVHYKIRFENTGTFPAQNIVVKDLIDTTKFDLSTLQMTDASHNCVTRINYTNKVEFIFENINLPFDDANNDGYVVFKIKTKPTLTINSTISNLANIYFDYNFPIVTNTATSTFQVLKTDTFAFDNYFSIYPNPVKNELNLSTKQATTVCSLSIYNTLGQQVQTTTNPEKTIDVSGLKTGNYIVKVTTDKGVSSSKLVKE